MALSARLQMRQTQSLVMTPQLLQSIRLLQYSHLELQSFVETEMERNPLLSYEPANAVADPPVPPPVQDTSERQVTGAESDGAAYESGFSGREDDPVSRPARGPAPATRGEGRILAADGDFSIDDLAERRPSLHAHALNEVADALAPGIERKLGEALVEHLDENGYLWRATEIVAAELGVEVGTVEAVLAQLQREATPAGLFARDLSECLALQLQRQDRLDPVMRTVLANLDLLARRDFAQLRRLTGEDESGLMEILSEIRALDPKPGHAFDHHGPEAIVPDVLVTAAADGGWQVELNPEALPRVLVDNDYLKIVRRGRLSDEDRSFIGECHQSANWLIRSLDQRAKTIVKVASEIVRRQDGFLTRGIGGLRPMTLMSVAEAIGMHESTVSRVTASKFISTPRGTFDMRFFFTVAIASVNGGDAHSAESVKHRIKLLIDAESQGKVMSDDDIAAVLRDEGIDLARRTVAKYREALGIPSSIQRRREMNARRLAS
ncbi:MAG: RNA polymerase factor sigma-54 [Aurantimonas endophytica]|uniref:RNA polymerase sigma-54 factor n=1 Tax=Aurantimonas endophytica TaxID=1522175 RepID=A0A7W6HHH8_9HYPH|nr:RNA polymerase factor sigma-54 [Aurantimonas endophytica]MBB4005287.1 RNA polymerase sigma-54 factor [Aurantimonas endophytica]MCO6406051.1 RNA polymerase factor sigma-54 [Aurantimonas endophytica]